MADGGAPIRLCETADINPDAPVRAEVDGTAYAVYQVDGEHCVTQDLCTHGPGNLSEGYVEGHEIECPFHQGRFDICTGLPAHAPCTVPLRIWPVEVRDGAVLIDPAKGYVNA